MRVRVFDNSSTDSYQSGSYTQDGKWWSSTGVFANQVLNVMNDVVVPEYEKEKNLGNLFFNPMSRYRRWSVGTGGLTNISAQNANGDCTGSWAYSFLCPIQDSNAVSISDVQDMFDKTVFVDLKNAAIAQAFANVDQTELLLGATLGEAPETLAFIANLFRRLISVVRFFLTKKGKIAVLKRLRKITAKEAADAVSDAWLELRYAVRPLVFEMDQAVKAFKKSIEANERFVARGKATWDDTYVNSFSRTVYTRLSVTQREEIREVYSARAGVLYNLSSDIDGLSLTLGLGNPIESVYELVPFSFILDWLLNIGDILAAWETNASLLVQGSWVTERLYRETKITAVSPVETWTDIGYTNVQFTIEPQDPCTVIEDVQLRTISPDKPVLPSVNVKLDLAKILDLVTIARGLFRATGRH